MKEIFTKSESFKEEYCAAIVKVGRLSDIEGSDNLKQAMIDGFSVVVNKNDIKEGDIVIYCKNETQLNQKFLSVNNMFEIGEYQLNSNHKEVERLIAEDKKDDAKKMVGYFNKNGRVKMIRLRGCLSIGVLIKPESLAVWDKECEGINLEDWLTYTEEGKCIPFDFDTVGGKEFIKVYVPHIPEPNVRKNRCDKRNRQLKKFDRMIPGEFSFHYDTSQLESNMWKIKPDDIITVDVKVHGTSSINSNILVKKPLQMDAGKKWWNRKINRKIKATSKRKAKTHIRYDDNTDSVLKHMESMKAKEYTVGYGDVYSSRTVIKNRLINPGQTKGYYDEDVWSKYNEIIYPFLKRGMTVYSEIFGYQTGSSDKMIQKMYDYGCPQGENKMMPYRITTKTDDGKTREWDVMEVKQWTETLIRKNEWLKDFVAPITILYHGKAFEMYPELDTDTHWRENFLQRLKEDKETLGMELDEPLCKNKVPREGVCVRIDGDPIAECFKLKTNAFRMREQKLIDKGEVDSEMAETYA